MKATRLPFERGLKSNLKTNCRQQFLQCLIFSSCLLHDVDRKVFWKNVLLSTVCAMFDVFLKNIGNCKRGKFSDGFGGELCQLSPK